MAKISIILVCMLVVVSAHAQPHEAFEKLTFTTLSDTLPYRLLHPEKIEPDTLYPLILFLHGAGERGHDNEQNLKYITELFLLPENRKQYPGFVLVPQCKVNARWTPEDWYAKPNEPINSVVELLDSLTITLPVDKNRVYVMGLSMGGYGTWYLITRYPEKFAAAIPICGGGDWNQAHVIRHIPTWVFHGKKDTVVLPEQSRKMVQALKKAGAKPRYTEYKKAGHDSWTPAFREPDLLNWLFSHRLFSD
jgi:predicted peptidase